MHRSDQPGRPAPTPRARPNRPAAACLASGPRGTRNTGYQEGYRESADYDRREGGAAASFGGATLAAVLMIFTGLVGFFQGLVGLIHGSFDTVHPNYIFTVGSWGRGLTQLILGAVIFAAGACLLLGMAWARAVGIVLAVLYGVASFLFLPWYPFWSRPDRPERVHHLGPGNHGQAPSRLTGGSAAAKRGPGHLGRGLAMPGLARTRQGSSGLAGQLAVSCLALSASRAAAASASATWLAVSG